MFNAKLRRMKKLLIIGLILITGVFYGCREKYITYDNNGETIHLMVDQVLKVALPSNASTGNDWRKTAYDDKIIDRLGKPNYMLSDGRTGSPGVTNFRFKAIKEGESKLYLEYGNKYKSEKEPEKIFEVTVIVIPKR